MRTRLSVSLSEDLIAEIDEWRGLAKRSSYMEHLIRLGLDQPPSPRPSST